VAFTHNPVFKEASADDAKLGFRAPTDLDQIIELSSQVQKSSEKLVKEVQQTP